MKILIINGPNLNLLGKREPEIYGYETLDDIIKGLKQGFPKVEFQSFQSNSEGELIDTLQKAGVDGAVFNPGAYSHYSYALYDCVRAVNYPVIEVHISNLAARQQFRQTSVIAPACVGSIHGLGTKGYSLAVEALVEMLKRKK